MTIYYRRKGRKSSRNNSRRYKSNVGTAAMADGTMMVTYNKMPLYTFVKDKQLGDVTGQDSQCV